MARTKLAVGVNVKVLRLRHGETSKQLSRVIGVGERYLLQMERSHFVFTTENIEQIAKHYKCSVEELYAIPDTVQNVLVKLASMSDEEKIRTVLLLRDMLPTHGDVAKLVEDEELRKKMPKQDPYHGTLLQGMTLF